MCRHPLWITPYNDIKTACIGWHPMGQPPAICDQLLSLNIIENSGCVLSGAQIRGCGLQCINKKVSA